MGSDDTSGIYLPFVNTVMKLDYHFQEDICCMGFKKCRHTPISQAGKH
jgi:hypothetical protein